MEVFLGHLMFHLAVPEQVELLRAAEVAVETGERLLPRVTPDVPDHVPLLREDLPAEVAGEGAVGKADIARGFLLLLLLLLWLLPPHGLNTTAVVVLKGLVLIILPSPIDSRDNKVILEVDRGEED